GMGEEQRHSNQLLMEIKENPSFVGQGGRDPGVLGTSGEHVLRPSREPFRLGQRLSRLLPGHSGPARARPPYRF
ncbi:hypothetical protein PFISCL1PPCAC_4468, partial [Pristionchus fissidentatus]